MSNTILYRSLDANHDPIWGNGTANFLADIYAVAQAIDTTLLLFTGEWFAALNAGTAMFNNSFNNGPSILGYPNSQATAASTIIQQRILSVPYVTQLVGVETAYSSQDRMFVFACVVQTVFGPISVATAPGLSASLVVTNSSMNLLTGVSV